MKKIKKFIAFLVGGLTLAACGAQGTTTTTTTTAGTTTQAPVTVKIAVVGSQAKEVWEFVAEKAKKENINLEVIEMNDYVTPNTALQEGSVHMNAFQHRNYLAKWNQDRNTNLKEIGTTFITPLYFFSSKYKSLDELPNGATVVIPSEVAIQGRALVALQTAGLIQLKDGGHTNSTPADVISNPRNLEFKEVASAQAVATLQDVDAATINGGMALDAGLKIEDNIFTDADYLETIPNDRYNIIVVRAEDENNEVYKKIVNLFQADDVVEKMNQVAPGQYYPVWNNK